MIYCIGFSALASPCFVFIAHYIPIVFIAAVNAADAWYLDIDSRHIDHRFFSLCQAASGQERYHCISWPGTAPLHKMSAALAVDLLPNLAVTLGMI